MIIIIDDFIKDESLKMRINDSQILTEPGVYKWWNGWWNGNPTNVEQELIEYVWKNHCPIRETFQISGFEFWSGIQSAEHEDYDNNLILHKDRDEGLWDVTKETVNPVMGSVYYPSDQSFEGGFLEVYSNGTDSEPERIMAKPNRLIIFEAGNVFHRVSVVTKGTRKAIAINLWKDLIYSETLKQNVL